MCVPIGCKPRPTTRSCSNIRQQSTNIDSLYQREGLHLFRSGHSQRHVKRLLIVICHYNNVPNRREALVEVLTKALDGADVVITTGGVSMGEKVVNNFAKASNNVQVCVYTGLIETCFGNRLWCCDSFRACVYETRVCAVVVSNPGTAWLSLSCSKPTTFATAQRDGKTKLVFALPGNTKYPAMCIIRSSKHDCY